MCISSHTFSAEETPDEVNIDADSVVYQENTGIATADGNVKVRNKTMRCLRLMLNTTATISCGGFFDRRGKVTLFSGPDKTDRRAPDLQP